MIKVALCQCGSTGTPEENQRNMESLFAEAVGACPDLDLIVYPETAYYTPANSEESLRVAIDPSQPHPFLDSMKALAKKHRVNVVSGSFVEKAGDNKVYNTVLFINRAGEIIGKYRKVHLFDAAGYKESNYVEPGESLCVIDTDIGRLGIMVCYDLRFPEQARSMCLQGAEMIIVPSEFPVGQPLPSRVDDWDILIRSTALTNLTYVVAVNQYGNIHNDHPFGRSGVVDPRGTIIASAQGRQGVTYGTIDLEYQRTTQKNLAVWQNRKPEIYTL